MADARKTALITGASAGLGAELARLFAADGHNVVLVARRRQKLEALADELQSQHGIVAQVLAHDLSDAAAPPAIFDELQQAGTAVDFLVNNAGFGSSGAFLNLDLQRELDMIAVNVRALVHLTGLFLPGMVERGSGRILNLGSTAGFQAGPYMTTYYATKAFVNHFSEGLWHELRETGVTVTVHCPGPTATEFASQAALDHSKLFTAKVATAQEVALHAYRAMHAGKRMAVHGLRNKLGAFGVRLAPRGFVHWITQRLNTARNDAG